MEIMLNVSIVSSSAGTTCNHLNRNAMWLPHSAWGFFACDAGRDFKEIGVYKRN